MFKFSNFIIRMLPGLGSITTYFSNIKGGQSSNTTNVAASIKVAASKGKGDLFALLGSAESGLTEEAVEQKREAFGLNDVTHDKAPAWYVQLIQAFIDPFIGVLMLIAIVSFITDVVMAGPGERDYKTVIVVATLIILSSMIRFWQEFRSNIAAEKLKSLVKTTATALRSGTGRTEIDIKEIVPGDIIYLSAGDMIPADCRVLQSKDLFVSQSILTGEAMPVEKKDLVEEAAHTKSPLELENICFMGTNIESGTATAIAVTTGSETYFGNIGKSLVGKRPETSFDKGVKSVSWLLIRFMIVMVPLVFLLNGFIKHDWLEAFLFALALAVGLTPAMLPMIVTANLARGAVNMSKRKVIVKRLNAIQNIGAMDILCTDKTGTLTMDKIVLERYLNVNGVEDTEVLKWAYLNSFYQTGLKNLLDIAVLDHVEIKDYLRVEETFTKVDEIPFDFQRHRMSVILAQEKNHKHLLICKGAVEEVLDLCTHSFD
ncbi:MAG: mgtA, partial [Bacteroidetes bacterium]|nr:mgtA [Bacteroidota bacterium]